MKDLKMSIEQAKELFKLNPELRNNVLSVFTNEELGIDEFPYLVDEVEGFFVGASSHVVESGRLPSGWTNINVNVSKLDRESYLAECQLRQIAKICNGGDEESWINWSNSLQRKQYAYFCENRLMTGWNTVVNNKFIYFRNVSDLEKSLIHHKDLWLQYFKVKK